jgi:DNA repair protein RadC
MNKNDKIINQAMTILMGRLQQTGEAMSAPSVTANYIKLKVAALEHEVFGTLWLNTQHQVLADEILFRGTISSAAIYPREVVKAALACNAAAAIFYHNHPSQVAEPSHADIAITSQLVNALSLIEVRVLDHIVIGGMNHASFAERGLI